MLKNALNFFQMSEKHWGYMDKMSEVNFSQAETLSTSTDTLEVLTNATPIDQHLKMRKAQEVVRIRAEYDDEPLRDEFNDWIGGGNAVGRKPTIFHMLMCRFREMSGRLEFDSIEKDFKYSKDLMGLIKEKGKMDAEEFKNTKTDQVENIREILGQMKMK